MNEKALSEKAALESHTGLHLWMLYFPSNFFSEMLHDSRLFYVPIRKAEATVQSFRFLDAALVHSIT